MTRLTSFIVFALGLFVSPSPVPAQIPVCTLAGVQDQIAVAAGDSFFVVTWRDGRDDATTSFDIYAQAFDWLGNPMWNGVFAAGVPISTMVSEQDQPTVAVGPDETIWLAWRDKRNCTGGEVFYQVMDLAGATSCSQHGDSVRACQSGSLYPNLLPLGGSSAIVSWNHRSPGGFGFTKSEVRAQRILGTSCALQWGMEGAVVHNPNWTVVANQAPLSISDGAGGAILVWEDDVGKVVRARRMDGAGNLLWPDAVQVSIDNAPQRTPMIAPDGLGGVLVVWSHGNPGTHHVRAQRVDGSGTRQWGAAGKVIALSSGDLQRPQIVRSTLGRSFVIWEDTSSPSESDIHATRIDLLGDTLSSRVVVSQAPFVQTTPQAAPGPSGSAFVVWQDGRNLGSGDDADLYTQRIDADGNLLCALDGEPFAAQYPSRQYDPRIVAVTAGGSNVSPPRGQAIVVWNDTRNGDPDIYAAAVLDSCPTIVTAVGDEVSSSSVALGSAVPNPFSAGTSVRLVLPGQRTVSVRVLDVSGRVVRILLDGSVLESGSHVLHWDGRAASGQRVSPGVYFYRVRAGGWSSERRVVALGR